ncbi:hypothetical protein MAH1_27130 [Sessilibacter sp. MAH1]
MFVQEPVFKHLNGTVWDQLRSVASDISQNSSNAIKWLNQAESGWKSEVAYDDLVAELKTEFPGYFQHYGSWQELTNKLSEEVFACYCFVDILNVMGYFITVDWKESGDAYVLSLLSQQFELLGLQAIDVKIIDKFAEDYIDSPLREASSYLTKLMKTLAQERGCDILFCDNGNDETIFATVSQEVFSRLYMVEINNDSLIFSDQ